MDWILSDPTREGHCPTGLQTSIPHRRQDTTNDFSLERNTQERHARRITAANAFHSPRALLAFHRPKPSLPPSHRQPTRSHDQSLPPDGDIGIRAVGPRGSIYTGALLQPWIREDLRRAHHESRDDQCSFPHHLPGITAKLLSLTLWGNLSPGKHHWN